MQQIRGKGQVRVFCELKNNNKKYTKGRKEYDMCVRYLPREQDILSVQG